MSPIDEMSQQSQQASLNSQQQENSIPCLIYQDPSSQLHAVKFDATFKLILIGNSGVGKTCIIKRIGHNKFSEEHEVTIGAEFTTIAAHVNQKSFIKMQFWDSCGQERFNSITRIFYRGSKCVMLVYEVNNMQSLRDLQTIWISDIQSSLKDALLILVGNKADIDQVEKHKSKRQVTKQEGENFMKKHNLHYFLEVSAKSGTNINTLVEYIARHLYTQNKDNLNEYKDTESSASFKSRRSSAGHGGDMGYQQTIQSSKTRGSSKRIQNKVYTTTKKNKGCC